MGAVARWIRADMRASAGQATAVAGVVAGVMTALLLSAGLLQGATNPWQGLFTASRGAQIWLHLAPRTYAASLRSLPDVTAMTSPDEATAATMAQPWQRTRVELRAMRPVLPAIGRPLVSSGRWLSSAVPGGVVLEVTLAEAVHAAVGDELTLDNVDGSIATRVRVVGLAETADQGFYPDQTPGLIWVLPGLLQRVEPDPGRTQEVVGLQISDPDRTGFVVQEVVTQVGSSAVGSVSTWQQVKQSMARRDPLLGLVLALFGLVALGAAVLAIINVTTGRVLVQHAELGMLQALGFTPAQLTLMLTAEHGLLTAAGIVAGLLGARLLMPLLLGAVPGGSAASVAVPAGWSALIVGGTFAAVVLATAVPAWRAGRVWPAATVRAGPRGHLSRLASTAMAARLPPAIVLGSRAAFVRRMPAVLTIAGLAVPMLMITIGLGFWATLDDVQANPAGIGLATVTVGPGSLTMAQAGHMIAADRDVRASYRCVQAVGLVPGETTTITTLGMGTSGRPYPFDVVFGHLYHAPEQAVATQALLDAFGVQVGQFLQMYFGGVPVTFRIVGRIIDPQYGGEVLAYGTDTLPYEGAPSAAEFYSLVLRPGVPPSIAASRLRGISGGRLDIGLVSDPGDQLGVLRGALGALIGVLALIALTSLLTALRVGIRDHQRDVQVLRAMGLTPGQIKTAVVVRTTVLAFVAVTFGALAGRFGSSYLIGAVSQAYGLGAGLGRAAPPYAVAVTVAVAVIAAAAAGALSVRTGNRIPAAVVLGP